jgi:hypothetical protein
VRFWGFRVYSYFFAFPACVKKKKKKKEEEKFQLYNNLFVGRHTRV